METKSVNRSRLFIIFFICAWAKFILFNIIWCRQTTFAPLSSVETWVNAMIFSFIFVLPLLLFRLYKTTISILLLLDIFFICNLAYFRTYYTIIPLDSYSLFRNMLDFTDSFLISFRTIDLIFPALTVIPTLLFWGDRKKKIKLSFPVIRDKKAYIKYSLFTAIIVLVANFRIFYHGGYVRAYESLYNEYKYSYVTPMYTIFGSLLYQQIKEQEQYSPAINEEIKQWFTEKEDILAIDTSAWKVKPNCIIILAESLESWVLEKTVDDVEITPHLNKLLNSSGTIYVPKTLSQVKGGRSIDAQLLINAGLLPVHDGSYSSRFPETEYPGLPKAFKEKYPEGKAYSITVDKPFIWNQSVIAPAFGYDKLIDKYDFIEDEMIGEKKKLGDASFLRQVAGKIANGEVWSDTGNNFLQLITYSGHLPFCMPENLKRVSFPDKIPSLLNDYMTVANYTDYAIGEFIRLLKEQGRFDDTLLIITGDHEGLSSYREELAKHPVGKDIICDKPYVPFIVVNSPVTMRYEQVAGQIDIYPTLQQLLGLNAYRWTGLGESILSNNKKGIAIDPGMEIYGDTTTIATEEIDHLRNAWTISDMIIRHNYLSFDSL